MLTGRQASKCEFHVIKIGPGIGLDVVFCTIVVMIGGR